jgi:energy-coupling factor transporter ATP-binding protein EcfA2
MSEATEMAQEIAEALEEVGVTLTLTRTVIGTGSDDSGDTTTTHQITAVVSPASGGTAQAFDIRIENGTLITTNLRALKIAAYGLAIVPRPGDKITGIEDSTWTILGCTPQSFQGVNLVFDATVQR